MSKKSSTEYSHLSNDNDNSSPFIRFRLISGRNLVSRDINGFSDPFVVIKVEGGRVQSGKQMKTLNPEWNEILDLVPDWSRFPTTIKMVCWDWDRFGRDFMGEVKISMKSLFNEDGTPILWRTDSEPGEGMWYPLEARLPNDKIHGDIQFEMGIVASSDKHLEILNQYYYSLSQADKLTASSQSEISSMIGESSDSIDKENGGLVFLDIVSASDLPYDKAVVGNSFDMDPFVVVTLGKTTFKTSTIRHDRNPIWNERMIFKVTPEMLSYNVKFSVYDYDKFSNNDFIGTQTTPLHLLLANCTVDDSDPDLLHQVRHLNVNQPASYNANMEPINSPGLVNIKPKEYVEPTATTFALGLELAKKGWQEKFQSKLTIKASFLPYATIRKNFWYAMTKSYDSDGNGHMNLDEITTMLESLESTVCEDTVRGFFHRYNKTPPNDELTFTELVACLEELMNNSRVGGSRPSSPNPNCSSEHVVSVKHCPICQTQFHSKKDSDLDIVSHISLCYSADPSKIDRIIMGNMVTEAHAQRKWFTKIATYVGYGSYETGVDNANILVQDRRSGEVIEEKMPVYIRMGIRLLYRTGKSATTSSVKKILRNMSIKQGEKYTDILSKREIAPFIRFHNLNTEEILDPLDSFQNFNEFFYRKLKPGFRKLGSEDPRVAVSPADSRVMVFPTIDIAKDLWIKGENFSVQNLVKSAVKDPQLIDSLNQGSLAIFRLAPQDYHRFHIPVDGIIGEPHKIEGEYYTVNPMAIRSNLDVYGNNTRVVSVINSPEHGNVVVCCIGAMMVGSIVLTSTPNQPVQRLQEHGYFAFGGSTIVVLFEKGKIVFDRDLVENSQNKIETLLAVGNQIGVKP